MPAMLPILLATLVGATPPEMVVLPPQPLAAKPNIAADVFKAVLGEVEKQKDTLGVSAKLQKDAKAAIGGPAKEQAWECANDPACLSQLGTTLGADYLITGVIDKDSVAFLIVDVKNQKKIVGARSSKKMAKAGPKKQAEAAFRGALSGFEQWSKNPKGPPPVTEGAEISPTLAELRISAAELENVTEVSLDGVPLPKKDDGSIAWSGPPGSRHVLLAVRRDGVKSSQDVMPEAGAPVDIKLVFIEPAPPPPPPPLVAKAEPLPPPESKPATSKWWFWVGIGGAVLVGGATAALLVGGNKGGPTVGSANGSIEGTY